MKKAKNIRGMQIIGEIMPVTLKEFASGRNFSKYTIIINWEKIVGKEIAANSYVSNIDRGTLKVKVKNSVWGHHLMMLKEEMMRKINTYLGENIINDIWFMAGYDKDNQNYESIETAEDEKKIKPVKLDKVEMEAARLVAGEIKDGELRDRFLRLFVKDMAMEKAKKVNNWQSCLNCEILVPPGKKYCNVCLINNDEENKIGNIEKILWKNPWLSYKEVRVDIESSLEEYNTAKKNLVCYYTKKIFSENGGKIFQPDLVMLLKEIKPENLTQDCIDDVIGEVRKRL